MLGEISATKGHRKINGFAETSKVSKLALTVRPLNVLEQPITMIAEIRLMQHELEHSTACTLLLQPAKYTTFILPPDQKQHQHAAREGSVETGADSLGRHQALDHLLSDQEGTGQTYTVDNQRVGSHEALPLDSKRNQADGSSDLHCRCPTTFGTSWLAVAPFYLDHSAYSGL